ncbi:SigE family RNA polymerase sigma factor [Nocardioides sp.]|uniref:SigE family RNA polymerase sigma factor n=1 Tax=Nocardioides sp. TaxID=35761 RepID=UPI002ED9FDED
MTTEDFDNFFRATWPRMFRTAYAVAGDAGAAEDALQAAYARAFARWGHVSSTDHPEAYVRRMVVNEVLGTRRRGWSRRERPHEQPPDHQGPAGAHDGPEPGVVERDAVWAAVLALPPRQRAVVVLRYYEDLSEEQIADVLGCSRGTVKSQASAALTNLRRVADTLEGDL